MGHNLKPKSDSPEDRREYIAKALGKLNARSYSKSEYAIRFRGIICEAFVLGVEMPLGKEDLLKDLTKIDPPGPIPPQQPPAAPSAAEPSTEALNGSL